MRPLRDWLFGPPRSDAELRLGAPPCSHSGSRIAPAMEDPDQRIICCRCGDRLRPDGPSARERVEEHHRQREFEDLKAWAESLPELVLRLRPGEAHFAAVYEPATPMPGGPISAAFYGMTVPMERLMEASGDLPEEQMDRFVEELVRHVRVVPGGGTLRSGRPNPVPFDSVHLKGRFRPEVYTVSRTELTYGQPSENRPEDLDRLVRARERLRARNLPGSRLFLDRELVVHVRVAAWGTQHGGGAPRYDRMDRSGLSLSPVKVGVVL